MALLKTATFLYTPSNAEFNNNSSTLKNSVFVKEPIKGMVTADTVKECLTKPNVLNTLSVVTKYKKHLILDHSYVNNHLFKDKIKSDDWKFSRIIWKVIKATCLNST